jgi:hypothetical protein
VHQDARAYQQLPKKENTIAVNDQGQMSATVTSQESRHKHFPTRKVCRLSPGRRGRPPDKSSSRRTENPRPSCMNKEITTPSSYLSNGYTQVEKPQSASRPAFFFQWRQSDIILPLNQDILLPLRCPRGPLAAWAHRDVPRLRAEANSIQGRMRRTPGRRTL